MADAVLENYNLGPALNAGSFVEAMQGAYASQARNKELDIRQKELAERDKERQAALNAQNSEFLTKQLDANKYKGTPFDDENAKEIGGILDDAQLYASQGMPMSQIQQAIGKRLTEFNSKYQAQKALKSQLDQYGAQFKGVKGFNFEALNSHANQLAFYNENKPQPTDPGNGTPFKNPNPEDPSIDKDPGFYIGPKSPVQNPDPGIEVSPNAPSTWTEKNHNQLEGRTNWYQEAINRYPEDVSNSEGIDEVLKGLKREPSGYPQGFNTTIGKDEYNVKYGASLFPFQHFSDEKDQYGIPKSVNVESYPITDGDKPIMIPEFGPDGKQIGEKPMVGVSQQTLERFEGRQGVTPYLMGLAKKEFQKTGLPMPKEGSPQWELWKRHELYNYLNSSVSSDMTKGAVKTADSQRINMMVNPLYQGAIHDIAYQRRTGTFDADNDYGVPLPGTKASKEASTTVADGVTRVYQGNYTAPTTEYKGKTYEDITGVFPKGSLKFGASGKLTYDKVMFDPETNEVKTVYINPSTLAPEEHTYTEAQMGQFVGSHSLANGSKNINDDRKILAPNYQGGKFLGHREFDATAADQMQQNYRDKTVDDATEGTKIDMESLKKLEVPDGHVSAINARNGFQSGVLRMDGYSVDIKNAKGTVTKTFKTKDDLLEYLKTRPKKAAETPAPAKSDTPAPAAAPAQPAAAPASAPKGKKKTIPGLVIPGK